MTDLSIAQWVALLWLAVALLVVAALAYTDGMDDSWPLALVWPFLLWIYGFAKLGDWTRARKATQHARILRYLQVNGRSRGMDLVRAGLARRATVYILLSDMESRGLVESVVDEDDQYKRRWYTITAHGMTRMAPGPAIAEEEEKSHGQ